MKSNNFLNFLNYKAVKILLFFLLTYLGIHAISHLQEKKFNDLSQVPNNFKLLTFKNNQSTLINFSELDLNKKNGVSFKNSTEKGTINSTDNQIIEYEISSQNQKITSIKLKVSDDDGTEWFYYSVDQNGTVKPIAMRILHVAYMLNSALLSLVIIFLLSILLNRYLKKERGA